VHHWGAPEAEVPMKSKYARLALLISTLAFAGTSLADNSSSGGWTEYNYDTLGTRDNVAEKTLSTSNVGGLKIEWQYATPGPASVPGGITALGL
jgi:hypothetical protein